MTGRKTRQKAVGAAKSRGATGGPPRRRSRQGKAAAAADGLSLRAYAKHRGVSHQAVMRAIARGRLVKSVAAGRIVNVALADREWAANTDLSRAPDAVKAKAAGHDTSSHVHTPAPTAAVLLEPQAHGGALKRALALPDDGVLPGESLAGASAREKHFRAKLAELKYQQASGELVNAAEIQAQLVDVFTTCRTKLLGIPSKAKQRLPHLTLEDLAAIDDVVRESLEELVPPAAPAQGAAA